MHWVRVWRANFRALPHHRLLGLEQCIAEHLRADFFSFLWCAPSTTPPMLTLQSDPLFMTMFTTAHLPLSKKTRSQKSACNCWRSTRSDGEPQRRSYDVWRVLHRTGCGSGRRAERASVGRLLEMACVTRSECLSVFCHCHAWWPVVSVISTSPRPPSCAKYWREGILHAVRKAKTKDERSI